MRRAAPSQWASDPRTPARSRVCEKRLLYRMRGIPAAQWPVRESLLETPGRRADQASLWIGEFDLREGVGGGEGSLAEAIKNS